MRITRGRVITGGIAGILAAGALSLNLACSSQLNDQGGIGQVSPDYAVTILNADNFPNITLMCFKGVAFATDTRDYGAILRVPEWDPTCVAHEPANGQPRPAPSASNT